MSPRATSPFIDAAEIHPDGGTTRKRLMRSLLGRSAPAPTAPPPNHEVRTFVDCVEGSGDFGRWIVDEYGLPAYRYEMDHLRDPRAIWPNSEGVARRDHWHQVGNDRLNALASNDGTVQVYLGDTGGMFLNRFEAPEPKTWRAYLLVLLDWALWLITRFHDRRTRRDRRHRIIPRVGEHPDYTRHAYAGGFAYVHDGHAGWATAYRYRPPAAQAERIFGTGYTRMTTTHRGVRVTRHTFAPTATENTLPLNVAMRRDDPALITDVTVSNLTDEPLDLVYYEYWDINAYQCKLQWFRTGLFALTGDEERHAINAHFTPSVAYDDEARTLRFCQQTPENHRAGDKPDRIDWHPANIFLADLSGTPDAHYTNKTAFFGMGNAKLPDVVRQGNAADPRPDDDSVMPYCLVLRRDLHLEAGESLPLRFAYGAVEPDDTLEWLDRYRLPEVASEPAPEKQQDTIDRWRERLVYFNTGQDAVLHREMAWHAHYLSAATLYNRYYGAHRVPQGSTYLYLHGASGAPRDLALTVLPLCYVRPKLARETLRQMMMVRFAGSGALTYAFAGYGIQDNALGLHATPSDLDLFFFLALAEYLAATGDVTFLDEPVAYYPPHVVPTLPPDAQGKTTLDHVRAGVTHLLRSVGTGPNGLICVGDGDWSDAIVIETSIQNIFEGVAVQNSKDYGESIPNTQLALYVLPLLANQIEAHDAELAAQMRAPLAGWQEALRAYWNCEGDGAWYARAVLRNMRNEAVIVGHDKLDLEAQPWALIGGFAEDEAALIAAVKQHADDPSPIGAVLVSNEVWPAISQLLTWGYTRRRPDLAWRSLHRNTLAARATAFPDVWFDVWSGPDGVSSTDGSTWASPVTPMTDFPTMNSNPHGMALLGLLRVCGVEPAPSGDGVRIAPSVPRESFTLQTQLLHLDVAPHEIGGQYHAVADGALTLYVRVPADAPGVQARIDDQPVQIEVDEDGFVPLPLTFAAGQTVSFSVQWGGSPHGDEEEKT